MICRMQKYACHIKEKMHFYLIQYNIADNVCLYLYCSWKSNYRRYKVRIPLTGIMLSHSITCPKPWPRFPVPCVDAFFVKRLEVKGGYSFCWYWWNCWPSLFKLLFIWLHLRRYHSEKRSHAQSKPRTHIIYEIFWKIYRKSFIVEFVTNEYLTLQSSIS